MPEIRPVRFFLKKKQQSSFDMQTGEIEPPPLRLGWLPTERIEKLLLSYLDSLSAPAGG